MFLHRDLLLGDVDLAKQHMGVQDHVKLKALHRLLGERSLILLKNIKYCKVLRDVAGKLLLNCYTLLGRKIHPIDHVQIPLYFLVNIALFFSALENDLTMFFQFELWWMILLLGYQVLSLRYYSSLLN